MIFFGENMNGGDGGIGISNPYRFLSPRRLLKSFCASTMDDEDWKCKDFLRFPERGLIHDVLHIHQARALRTQMTDYNYEYFVKQFSTWQVSGIFDIERWEFLCPFPLSCFFVVFCCFLFCFVVFCCFLSSFCCFYGFRHICATFCCFNPVYTASTVKHGKYNRIWHIHVSIQQKRTK